MLDYVKENPWLVAGATVGVIGTGALGYWIVNGSDDDEIFSKDVRADLSDFIKKFRKAAEKGKPIKLSPAEKKELKAFLNKEVADGSLAAQFMEVAEPLIGGVFSISGKKATFAVSAESLQALSESADSLEKILKKMEKKDKEEKGWFRRL